MSSSGGLRNSFLWKPDYSVLGLINHARSLKKKEKFFMQREKPKSDNNNFSLKKSLIEFELSGDLLRDWIFIVDERGKNKTSEEKHPRRNCKGSKRESLEKNIICGLFLFLK